MKNKMRTIAWWGSAYLTGMTVGWFAGLGLYYFARGG